MFNFFKNGEKSPAESESKDPWEEVRTEPVLGAVRETSADKPSDAKPEEVDPFEEIPPENPPAVPSTKDDAAPAGNDIPVWASAPSAAEVPGASDAPVREATLEADRPEPMVTKPVPRESLRRAEESKGLGEGEAAGIPSHEEVMRQKRVRHRMIGAAALLLALVLVTPFALDDEERLDEEKMNLEIPDPAAMETPIAPDVGVASGDVVVAGSGEGLSTGAANLESEALQKPDTKAKDGAVQAVDNTKPAKSDVKTEPKGDGKSDAKAQKSEDAKSDVPTHASAPSGAGYYIQVLATSSELSAEKLVKDMTLQGLPAYKTSVRQNGKTLWRVRVGLFKTKAEAENTSGLLMLNNFASKPIVSYQKASGK